MNFIAKIILTLCIFAGFGNAMTHQYTHGNHDECSEHSSQHSGSDHEDSHGDKGDAPTHHHHCCHFPSADRSPSAPILSYSFHGLFVEISLDQVLAPDEPFFVLDKPPLI